MAMLMVVIVVLITLVLLRLIMRVVRDAAIKIGRLSYWLLDARSACR